MCGRFAITLPPEAMRQLFGYIEQPNFPPRHNIAPAQPIPIVRAEVFDGRIARRFTLVRWGFLPGFVRDPKDFPLIFNARAEGLRDKASFRNAVRRRRCLVPADAFYEWQRGGSGKAAQRRPYICRRADGATMALAGLWETWTGPNGEEVDTACIVTTVANAVSAAVHPRLPVVLEQKDLGTWLDPDECTVEAAVALLRPPGDDVLTFAPVADLVNRAENDRPDIMLPIGAALQGAHRSAEPSQPSLF